MLVVALTNRVIGLQQTRNHLMSAGLCVVIDGMDIGVGNSPVSLDRAVLWRDRQGYRLAVFSYVMILSKQRMHFILDLPVAF